MRSWVKRWEISTEHFDPHIGRKRASARRALPLTEILVEHSSYSRKSLKRRLYDEGIKDRVCELCGQGEEWNGRRMSLILDHINGVRDDNRLENLRIVCPNCAATFDTHCGRNRVLIEPRICLSCEEEFQPRYPQNRYCSRACVGRALSAATKGIPRPERRKVERPPYEQLMADIGRMDWSAVGRKYGVSDTAVRKWVRWYEAEREREAAEDGPPLAA